MFHQFLRSFDGRQLHARNHIFRCSRALGRFCKDAAGFADASHSRRMRTEDDRISSFQRNKRFINRCRGGIRRWNDRCDHSNRTGNLEDFLFFVFVHNSDGLHGPNSAVDVVSAEKILQRFVFDNSITRLVNGAPRKRLGVGNAGSRNFQKNLFDLVFREIFELQPGIMGGLDEAPCFLNRFEVLVHIRAKYQPGIVSPGFVEAPDQCRSSFSVSSNGRGMT